MSEGICDAMETWLKGRVVRQEIRGDTIRTYSCNINMWLNYLDVALPRGGGTPI